MNRRRTCPQKAPFLCESVELPGVALPALVVVQGDFLDDVDVDELLNVFVDGGFAHAGIEFLEFVHRGELLGVLENIVDQREPRLLGDEVDEFAWWSVVIVAETGAHNFGLTGSYKVVHSKVNYKSQSILTNKIPRFVPRVG